jgi:hypothetical protein
MPIPTQAGQYRRVRYSDDGCDIYQCLWCLNTIEIRDNPEWSKWNFCPKCGKSWFNRLQCRPSTCPAWAWNRYGPDDHNHPPYWTYPKATHEWYFETRHRWSPDDEWSEWHYEWKSDHDKLGEWRYAAEMLARFRADHQPRYPEDTHRSEFRVTLRKKI